MKGFTLFLCFVVLLCVENAQALQVDYIDSSWKSSINLQSPSAGYFSSGILKSHRGITYPSNLNKTFTVTAQSGYSLVISIKLIDLREMDKDQLMIFDMDGQVSPMTFTNRGHFRNRNIYPNEDLTFFAPKGRVGIRFTTGSSYFSVGYDGFELVYTAVGSGYLCTGYDARCTNGRCIAHDLWCDGHNHCGDQSSLKHCRKNTGTGRNVGITVGLICLGIAAACGIFIAVRKARAGASDTQTIITSHPPPSNLPSYPPVYPPVYPPAYPQPGTGYPAPPPPYSQGIVNPTYH